MSDHTWQQARALILAAGLQCRRAGECVWAWVEDASGRQSAHRYVDSAGLLASDDPLGYIAGCYRGRG